MTDIAPPDLSALFSPFTLKGLRLANRFVMPGMQRGWCEDGRLLPQMAEYYRRRVEGGIALVIGEGCAINHPSSIWEARFPRLNESTLEGWERCVRAVHAAGGYMLIQVSHPGAIRSDSQASPSAPGPALSPSGIFKAGKTNGRAATLEELAQIKAAFVEAALWAQRAGADGVELHACHGFLLDEFLWAQTNRREDGYGGDRIGERVRYPAEVVAAIRQAVGEQFVLSFRFSQWKEVDYEARIVHSPAELGVLLAALRGAGVDLFHASTRRFFTPEWPGSDLGLAGWTKTLTDAPVCAVGSVGLDIDVMETFFSERAARFAGADSMRELARRFGNAEFDLIGVGRSVIADPDWVRKIRDARYDEVRPFTKQELLQALEMEPRLIVEVHEEAPRR
ncbi:MAG TPA: hypothetical protein VMC02_01175 [Steroidobacteraceae bacterium]|nr:hypothetical protein [Steroidobacteraceae bacterium]